MSSSVPKVQILGMYKLLMRESQKFSNYNFRSYALRRIRDSFKSNKDITDKNAIKTEFEYAKLQLGIIKRQAAVGNMYSTDKLIIENRQ